MKTITLKDFLASPLEFTEEACWEVLEDFHQDLKEWVGEEGFHNSRWTRHELIKAIGILLMSMKVARRLNGEGWK